MSDRDVAALWLAVAAIAANLAAMGYVAKPQKAQG